MTATKSRRRVRTLLALSLVTVLASCATPWDKYPVGPTDPGPTTPGTPITPPTDPTDPAPPTPDPTDPPAQSAPGVQPGWIQPTGPAPTTMEEFYGQQITWGQCIQTSLECATIWAPLNWDNPSEGAITVAMARVKATGTAQGSLLSNPGGPGGSGIGFLSYFSRIVSPSVKEVYDLVSFDPRGVNLSTPVNCGTDAELNDYYLTSTPFASQADVDAAIQRTKEFGERCLELTGPVLGHIDTESAAKDMDLMRALLGDEKLTYLGYSYGTELGATYAGLFPQNVGRLVLDGAVDPSLTSDQMSLQQAAGFEQAFTSYVADCLTSSNCPLSGTVEEGLKQMQDLVVQADANPLPTGASEPLNSVLAYYGIIAAMYDDSSWPILTNALREAMQNNNGGPLHSLANMYLDRDNAGQWLNNSQQAFGAIGCLDSPSVPRTYEQMLAWRDEVAKVAPLVADDFAMGVGCQGWPFPATGKDEVITAAGAPPIVVIGTTGDPATPYQWSVNLANQLQSGVLVTYQGEGHTAYGRSNQCIYDAVDTFFLTGTPPADGTTC